MILKNKKDIELCIDCSGNYGMFLRCKKSKAGEEEFKKHLGSYTSRNSENCYHKANGLWGESFYPVLPENENYPFFPARLGIDYEYGSNSIIWLRKPPKSDYSFWEDWNASKTSQK